MNLSKQGVVLLCFLFLGAVTAVDPWLIANYLRYTSNVYAKCVPQYDEDGKQYFNANACGVAGGKLLGLAMFDYLTRVARAHNLNNKRQLEPVVFQLLQDINGVNATVVQRYDVLKGIYDVTMSIGPKVLVQKRSDNPPVTGGTDPGNVGEDNAMYNGVYLVWDFYLDKVHYAADLANSNTREHFKFQIANAFNGAGINNDGVLCTNLALGGAYGGHVVGGAMTISESGYDYSANSYKADCNGNSNYWNGTPSKRSGFSMKSST